MTKETQRALKLTGQYSFSLLQPPPILGFGGMNKKHPPNNPIFLFLSKRLFLHDIFYRDSFS